MDNTPTAQASETAEERTARHLRVLAELAEIQMAVARATQKEALDAPAPGVDYCQRIAIVSRSVRLTVLLEDKLSRPRAEPKALMSVEEWHRRRVGLAVAAAIQETAESAEESHRRCAETLERLEQPELVETIDAWPAEIAVARLCRMYGLPLEVRRWLDEADDLLEDEEAEEPVDDRPAASPGRRSAARRKPPDTG